MLRGRLPRFLMALALVACVTSGGPAFANEALGGGAATMPAAPVDGDLAALVPEGTHMLVLAPSIEGLVAKLRTVVGAFDKDAAEQVSVEMLLEQMPIGPLVDTAKPMAMAVSLPNGPEGPSPDMTFLCAVTDLAQAEEQVKSMGMESMPSSGMFVALRMGPEPAMRPAEVPAIARNLAAGDLAVRIDLAGLIALYRDMADGMLAEMDSVMDDMPTAGTPGLDVMMDGMKKSMKDFLDGAETLDVAMAIDGTTVHWKALLTGKDGSELTKTWSGPAGDGGKMAAGLPADFPLAMLMSFDIQKLYDWIEPMMGTYFDMMPEDARPRMQALWTKAVGLSEYMGDHHAIAYDFGEQGVRAVTVSGLKDAEKFWQGYDALLAGSDYTELMSAFGMEMVVLPMTEVAGIQIRHFRMTFDVEKMMKSNPSVGEVPPEMVEMMQGMFDRMLGKNGLEMHAANVRGKLVTVVGNQALLASVLRRVASGEAATDSAMAQAIRVAGGNPSFLVRVELRALLAGLFGMVREMMPPEQAEAIPAMPEGGPIPMLLYASLAGRYAAGGYVMDAGALAELVGYFMSMADSAMGMDDGPIYEEQGFGEEEAPLPERR